MLEYTTKCHSKIKSIEKSRGHFVMAQHEVSPGDLQALEWGDAVDKTQQGCIITMKVSSAGIVILYSVWSVINKAGLRIMI